MALLAAFVVSAASTPLAKKIALRAGAIDMPGKAGTRHHHKTPTPRMGGLAIFAGFFCSAFLFAPWTTKNISMLIGSVIIVALARWTTSTTCPPGGS